MKRIAHVFTVVAAIATAAVTPGLAAGQASAAPPGDPGIGVLRDQWKGAIENITAAAMEMTEAEYAYRPIETVRTFGGLVGHVAGTQNLVCAAVLGDPQPAEDAIEKGATTKAALVQALKASTAYCERAYAISGMAASAAVDLFGSKSTKFGALALNAIHDAEHYGNIVTYMRMQGKIPPSSRR